MKCLSIIYLIIFHHVFNYTKDHYHYRWCVFSVVQPFGSKRLDSWLIFWLNWLHNEMCIDNWSLHVIVPLVSGSSHRSPMCDQGQYKWVEASHSFRKFYFYYHFILAAMNNVFHIRLSLLTVLDCRCWQFSIVVVDSSRLSLLTVLDCCCWQFSIVVVDSSLLLLLTVLDCRCWQFSIVVVDSSRLLLLTVLNCCCWQFSIVVVDSSRLLLLTVLDCCCWQFSIVVVDSSRLLLLTVLDCRCWQFSIVVVDSSRLLLLTVLDCCCWQFSIVVVVDSSRLLLLTVLDCCCWQFSIVVVDSSRLSLLTVLDCCCWQFSIVVVDSSRCWWSFRMRPPTLVLPAMIARAIQQVTTVIAVTWRSRQHVHRQSWRYYFMELSN